MEAFLENGQYVCGDTITIADYCCITTTSTLDKFAPIDAGKYPKLVAWMKRMEALPICKDNAQGAAAELQKLLFAAIEKNKAEAVKVD